MQYKKRSASGNPVIRIALLLFCLVMLSFSLMSGLYARYVSNNGGTDSARVAKFDVIGDVWPKDVTVDVSAGEIKGSYSLIVTNNSEVAVRCSLALTFADALPEYITVRFNSGEGIVSADRKTVTFDTFCELAPAAADTAKTLEFTVIDVNKFTEKGSDKEYSETLAFGGTVTCVQID